MISLTVSLAALIGISLGLLGGGGSVLTVPLLVYVTGLAPQQAIALSLLVVAISSGVGSITHARGGRIQWRVAAIFGLASMAGAYAGGRVAHLLPGTVLLVAFAVIMSLAGIGMLHRRDETVLEQERQLKYSKMTTLGFVVGLICGLVGAGGGFLVVPALALAAGLPMPIAIGTSLVVIAMQSFAGFAGQIVGEHIDWRLAAMVTGAAAVGAIVGGRLVPFVEPKHLRQGFGWLVLGMASFMLYREMAPVAGLAFGAAVLITGVVRWQIERRQHPDRNTPAGNVVPSKTQRGTDHDRR